MLAAHETGAQLASFALAWDAFPGRAKRSRRASGAKECAWLYLG